MTNVHVPDWGNPNAEILLVGEAPGSKEVEQRKPFVGSSGWELQRWWDFAGLERKQFYITNVYPYQPLNNDISRISKEEMEHWAAQLRQKVDTLACVKLIIPTGSTALWALTGRRDIMNWRGSPMIYEDDLGRKINMVPTIHPAAVLRDKSLELRCIYDWKKIAHYLTLDHIPIRNRSFSVLSSASHLVWARQVIHPDLPIALDIETHPEEGITCVGFSQSADSAYCIPTNIQKIVTTKKRRTKEDKEAQEKKVHQRISRAVYHESAPLAGMLTKKPEFTALEKFQNEGKALKKIRDLVEVWEEKNGVEGGVWEDKKDPVATVGYWKNEEDNESAWQLIREICESPNPKILQNGFYDIHWLHKYGISVENYTWDTLSMHHLLFPTDSHSLDYISSIFTNEPFWKKEAKEATESGRLITKREALFLYNCKDCAVTYELFEILYRMLHDHGKLDFYHYHYRNLFTPLRDMMFTGLLVDRDERKSRREDMESELQCKLKEIESVAGYSLAGKTNLSSAKVAKYLYDDLGLPRQRRKRQKGERTDSADETAVRTLMLRHPQKMEKIGPLILRCRRLGKMLGALKDTNLDPDGRFRSQYKFTTTTGRLASAKNPLGTGGNAQNVDRELRHIFIAG